MVLLTLLGAAGEALAYDRMLKTNPAKRRVHSLFRQNCLLYDLIPTMRETRLRPLMQRFSLMLQEQPLFADVFGPVWQMGSPPVGRPTMDERPPAVASAGRAPGALSILGGS